MIRVLVVLALDKFYDTTDGTASICKVWYPHEYNTLQLDLLHPNGFTAVWDS